MARANASVPPEAIRIEDEVWEQAFTRREPPSVNRRRRLRAIDGGRSDWLTDHSDWTGERTSTSAPARVFDIEAAPAPQADSAELELPAATWAGTSTAPAETFSAPATVSTTPTAGLDASPPIRRTVKIQGRGAERHLPMRTATRRPSKRPYERAGFRPDRLAMWAVMLGFLLVLVAIVSAHG